MTTAPTSAPVRAEFDVSYDGSAVANHTMEIRDLAPALLALGQAFDRANSILNSDRTTMSLEIRATQAGSFEVGLILKQLYDQAVPIFSGDFITGAANMKELFFGGAVGGAASLFGMIKQRRGKRIKEAVQDGDNMIVFEADNVRLVIPTAVFKLYNDGVLREQLAAVVRPLMKDGIEKLVIKANSTEIQTVNKEEASYFYGPDLEFDESTTTVIPRQRLKPADVSFRKNGKWRLDDGEKVRFYAVRDTTFIKEVQDGTREIGAKDIFVCEVLMKQSVAEGGELKMEYEVSSVLSHIKPGTQARFVADDAGGIRLRDADRD